MSFDTARYLPVIVSILIIIGIAILREYSRIFAAIVAVAPINIPLGMWIIYAGAENKETALIEFSRAILVNIIPTILFMLVAWQMAKAGYTLIPVILGGYTMWAISLAGIFAIRSLLI